MPIPSPPLCARFDAPACKWSNSNDHGGGASIIEASPAYGEIYRSPSSNPEAAGPQRPHAAGICQIARSGKPRSARCLRPGERFQYERSSEPIATATLHRLGRPSLTSILGMSSRQTAVLLPDPQTTTAHGSRAERTGRSLVRPMDCLPLQLLLQRVGRCRIAHWLTVEPPVRLTL